MDQLKVLRFCEAVARLGNFTRAAQELNIAQPALSMSIAKLERELGVTLFHRLPRGAEPTQEGHILLARGARIFEELDSVRRELADAALLRSGRFSIGFPPMYGLRDFPMLLMGFRARFPGVEVTAIEGSATASAGQLDAGVLDLAIVEGRRVQPGWKSATLGVDEMVLAFGAGHPLARVRKLEPRHLQALPMVVLTPEFLQRQLLDAYCAAHGVRYRKVMECNYVHLTLQAAEAGSAGATLLRSMVRDNPRLAGLSLRPRQMLEFRLCWRDDRYLPRAAEAFVAHACER